MAYDTEKAKISRNIFEFVEFDVDNPISASGFERHCLGRGPLSESFYPSIVDKGIDLIPTRMYPGSGLSSSGVARFKFKDFRIGENGTYFGKLFANNPYLLDRPFTHYSGFFDGSNFQWDNFKPRLYYIKKVTGPDSRGVVTATTADQLTLLSEDQARTTITPNALLSANLSASYTGTLNIGDNTDYEAAGGLLRINDEYIIYDGISGADSIVINSSGRGAFGSEAEEHESGDNLGPCYSFQNENVVDVIRDLIELYSPIDHATYIPDSDWNDQRDNLMVGDNATGVIDPGTPIKDEINKLCEEFRISVWWDDEDQVLALKPIGPLVSTAQRINVNEHILNIGEDVVRDQSKAVTGVIVHYGRKNHAKDEKDKKNYSYHTAYPNPDAATGYGKDKIKEIFAQYIPAGATATSNKLADRINSQFAEGEVTYHFRLDVKDSDLRVGDVFEAFTDKLQGTDGLAVPTSLVVTEKDQLSPTVFQYRAIKTGFALGSKYRRIAPNSLAGLTYSAATTEQRATYFFIADLLEKFSNGDDGHWIYG